MTEKNYSKKSTGNRIRICRVVNGFTVEQFSEVTGIDTEELLRFEDGKKSVPLEEMVTISRAVGVSVDFLVCGDLLPKDTRQTTAISVLSAVIEHPENEAVIITLWELLNPDKNKTKEDEDKRT